MAEITDAVAMVRKSAGFGAAFAAALAGGLAEAPPIVDERARRVLAGAGARQLGGSPARPSWDQAGGGGDGGLGGHGRQGCGGVGGGAGRRWAGTGQGRGAGRE